jgi:hypothetical protein
MSTRHTTALFLACSALLAPLGACTFEVDPGQGSEEESVGQEDQTMLAARSLFYSVTRDRRTFCPAPYCGGYFLQALNRASPDIYVTRLELPRTVFDAETTEYVLGAPEGMLLVRASLTTDTLTVPLPYALVWEAYRGLPGFGTEEADSYYQVEQREPPIACFVAPCNNDFGHLLNRLELEDFTRVTLDRVSWPHMDAEWLTDRILHHDAIVTAGFRRGEKLPGGYETLMGVTQVFLRLPDRPGPCDAPALPRCPWPFVAGYTRDAERCLHFDACVDRDLCALDPAEACPLGFERTAWNTTGKYCTEFVCEPSFVAR